jgi:hypothetical protein
LLSQPFNLPTFKPSTLAFSHPMYSICPASMATDHNSANHPDPPQPGFLARTLFSTDHKAIGLNYLWLALFSVFLG